MTPQELRHYNKVAIEQEKTRIWVYLYEYIRNKDFSQQEIQEVSNIIFDKPFKKKGK